VGFLADPIDLDAYLSRVGLASAPACDLEGLGRLHLAHLSAIPFENVDVRLGRPILLDAESLQAKLVRRRRGGYCFEQNSLLAAVLRTVGFGVETLEARVRPPEAVAPLPRTHMTLAVRAEGRDYLADVGFGASGPLVPVPLDGSVSEQADGAYRVEREGPTRVLRRREGGSWRDLYAFSLAPALPVDFEVANHFTSTHPTSRFVTTLTAQTSEPAERRILRGLSYTVRREGSETAREIRLEELPDLLRDKFWLDLSDEEALLAGQPASV